MDGRILGGKRWRDFRDAADHVVGVGSHRIATRVSLPLPASEGGLASGIVGLFFTLEHARGAQSK